MFCIAMISQELVFQNNTRFQDFNNVASTAAIQEYFVSMIMEFLLRDESYSYRSHVEVYDTSTSEPLASWTSEALNL